MQTVTFDRGGLWENTEWDVQFDVECAATRRCTHCRPTTPAISPIRGERVRCPRVVVAINEGGHNSTGVCLDCIIEATATLRESAPLREKDE